MKRAYFTLFVGLLSAACEMTPSTGSTGARDSVTSISPSVTSSAVSSTTSEPQAPERSGAAARGVLTVSTDRGDVKFDVDELVRRFGTSDLVVERDPYYQKRKTFRVIPFTPIVEAAFGRSAVELADVSFVLEASDGYRVRLPGRRLLLPVVQLAYEDRDGQDWEPIGPKKAHPGPFYLTWDGAEYGDTNRFPHPWALVRVGRDEGDLERTRPPEGFGENRLAARGHDLFAERCSRCHAINRQGGRVGPELNVPRNVLSYRPRQQLREFVRDPGTFRYSAMPANRDLSEADLDALFAYLEVMARHPFDPESAPRKETGATKP